MGENVFGMNMCPYDLEFLNVELHFQYESIYIWNYTSYAMINCKEFGIWYEGRPHTMLLA
jgi:hypothetical protein